MPFLQIRGFVAVCVAVFAATVILGCIPSCTKENSGIATAPSSEVAMQEEVEIQDLPQTQTSVQSENTDASLPSSAQEQSDLQEGLQEQAVLPESTREEMSQAEGAQVSTSQPENAQEKPFHQEELSHSVVVIGDSIASGHVFGYDEPDPWPTFLQQQLWQLDTSWEVTNLGVSSTMLISTGAIPYRSTGNIEVAKEIGAGYVLVMLGTNDSYDPSWDADVYRSELRALVDELYAANPSSLVVLLSPPHVFCDPNPDGYGVFHMNDEIIGDQICPAMQGVAQETNSLYVDVYGFTEGQSGWFPDTVHPNGEGNRAIADFIFRSVFSQ